MTAYHALAQVYDQFMADGPHEGWIKWLQEGAAQGPLTALSELSVADIGCGTGLLAAWLAQVCLRVVGVDLSEDMLARAAQVAVESGVRVQYLCQDVRDLHLPFRPNLILSTCDCFNYLLEQSDWDRALTSVATNLSPHGWFCFDVLGPARVQRLSNGLWHDVADEAVVLYETKVTGNGRIQYDVHAFEQDDHTGLYHRIEEFHEQQYMDPTEIESLLVRHGFRVIDILGDFGQTEIQRADRVIFISELI